MANITKHYKTDFTILIKLLKDDDGVPYPFTIELYTRGKDRYIASWNGIESVNLLKEPTSDDDYATVMMDKHNLMTGEIKQETVWSINNEDWKNNVMYKAFSGTTGYELVATKSDVDGEELVLPVIYDMNLIRGDAFTYEDFTDEQIQTLQQPALDAAATANEATLNANAATVLTTEATNNANDAATNANNKAALADNAAINANAAADNANAASDSMLSNIISLEIKDDLNLYFKTPDTYSGMTFDISNGNLIATV